MYQNSRVEIYEYGKCVKICEGEIKIYYSLIGNDQKKIYIWYKNGMHRLIITSGTVIVSYYEQDEKDV